MSTGILFLLVIFVAITAVSGLRVLVVAASGHLGSALVREAVSRGHTVTTLATNAGKLHQALGPNFPKDKLEAVCESESDVLFVTRTFTTCLYLGARMHRTDMGWRRHRLAVDDCGL
jgi:nucleoside-diphosphate-sugar epimerase